MSTPEGHPAKLTTDISHFLGELASGAGNADNQPETVPSDASDAAVSDGVGELHDHPQTLEATRLSRKVGEGPLQPEGIIPASIIELVRGASLETTGNSSDSDRSPDGRVAGSAGAIFGWRP